MTYQYYKICNQCNANVLFQLVTIFISGVQINTYYYNILNNDLKC